VARGKLVRLVEDKGHKTTCDAAQTVIPSAVCEAAKSYISIVGPCEAAGTAQKAALMPRHPLLQSAKLSSVFSRVLRFD
jgi:hypothetical protein